jgi:hypothetical protein
MLLFSKWPLTTICLLTAAGLIAVAFRWKRQTHALLAMATMVLSAGTLIYAFWGLVHTPDLRQRAMSDYGYEGLGWIGATLAMTSGLLWTRKWFHLGSVILTVASAWLFLIFTMMLLTM